MRRKLKGITSALLSSIDAMNTMNGGIIEPRLRVYKLPSRRVIEMSVPGVPQNLIKADINNNVLNIYHLLEFESDDKRLHIPRIVYSKQIPYYVDTKKITASFDKDTLKVQLPFNELANGYHRDILATEE